MTIHRISMRRDATYTVVPAPAFVPAVRPMRDDELPYAIHSWSQGYHDAPGMRRKSWRDYKAIHVPVLRDALCRHDTQRLAVDGPVPGRAIGWLAFARWPSIDTLHWVYVAKPYRQARSRGLSPLGAMSALLERAGLRKHVTYTFLGPHSSRSARSDEWIAELLRSRGAIVSHVPFQEWSR